MVMLIRTGTLRIPATVVEFYAEHARRHDVDPEAVMVEVLRRVAEQKRIPAPVPTAVDQDAPIGHAPPPAGFVAGPGWNGGRRRAATTQEDETIRRMFAEGARQFEIARTLGRDQSFVLRRRRILGIGS